MNQPILRPPRVPLEGGAATTPAAAPSSTYPQSKQALRPGWKPTICRVETFNALRAIQKSTNDPVIDMSYLTDACLQMALEMGGAAIVRRALDGMASTRTTPIT